MPKFHRSINYIAAQLRMQRKERRKNVAVAAVVVKESSNDDTLKQLDEYMDELHSDLMNVMMDLEPLKTLKVKVDKQLADMHNDLMKLMANVKKDMEIIRSDIAEVAEEVDDVKAEAVRSKTKVEGPSRHCSRGAFDFDFEDDFATIDYTDWIRSVDEGEDAPAPKARKIKGKNKGKGKGKAKIRIRFMMRHKVFCTHAQRDMDEKPRTLAPVWWRRDSSDAF